MISSPPPCIVSSALPLVVYSAKRRLHPSGVSGSSRMRLPVALANALTIAATAGPCAPSPAPSDFSVWPVDELDLDVRRFLHGQDRIALPVARGDPVCGRSEPARAESSSSTG